MVVQVSQVALAVKNPPTNAGEVRVHSLGCEDPLEDSMATHSSILVWEIPWTEEPEGLHSMEMETTELTRNTIMYSSVPDLC